MSFVFGGLNVVVDEYIICMENIVFVTDFGLPSFWSTAVVGVTE